MAPAAPSAAPRAAFGDRPMAGTPMSPQKWGIGQIVRTAALKR